MKMEKPNHPDMKNGGKPDPITGGPAFARWLPGRVQAAAPRPGPCLVPRATQSELPRVRQSVAGVGDLAGGAIAERFDPTAEDAFWITRYQSEPYYEEDLNYDDYGPAYRYGAAAYAPGSTFDEVEEMLAENWSLWKGKSFLSWHRARDAVRASWDRADRSSPVD